MVKLSKEPSLSQRELARNSHFSLGLVNSLLKRLLDRCLITTSQINGRKLEYRLTEKGRAEVFRSSHATAAQILERYGELHQNISHLLQRLHQSGYTYFSINGDGRLKGFLADLIRSTLAESPVSIGQLHRSEPQSVVLNLDPEGLDKNFAGDVVNVFEEIG